MVRHQDKASTTSGTWAGGQKDNRQTSEDKGKRQDLYDRGNKRDLGANNQGDEQKGTDRPSK